MEMIAPDGFSQAVFEAQRLTWIWRQSFTEADPYPGCPLHTAH